MTADSDRRIGELLEARTRAFGRRDAATGQRLTDVVTVELGSFA